MSDHEFTPQRASEMDGPEWLVSQRVAAAERFAAADLPDDSLEEWRYSRVESVDLGQFHLPAAPTGPLTADEQARSDSLGAFSGRVVWRSGGIVEATLDADIAGRGVRFGRLADLDGPVPTSSQADGLVDPFTDLVTAFGAEPLVLSVPRGVTVELPFQVLGTVDGDHATALPSLVVLAGDDSDVSIVEWTTSGDDRALVVNRTDVQAGNAARVALVSVNDLGPAVVQLGATTVTVGQEATVRLAHAALGGDYARHRFDCRLVGRGATGRIAALYLGDDDQMHDLRTFQTHEARDTTSELVFKGALDDRAHAVYTGMIRVDHEGRGSNANQTNRVIKLSEDAWAESVPNLEINHNDVRCSHATAVGPIDEDQRFYLESRGVPPEAAERLVVNGFFEEVLDAMAIPAVAAAVRPLITAKLGSGA